MSKSPVRLSAIFLVFARIGAFSFGGGLTGWVYREVVQQRAWLTEQEFISGMALSQMLPGANITNLSIYVGQRLRGSIGAFTALVAILITPFFLVIGFFALYDTISSTPWIGRTIGGIAAAAIGLLIFATWRTGKHAARSIHGAVIMAATYVAVGVFHWPLLPVVLCITPLSVAAAWKWKKPDAP